ncbi:MAG: ABC transporter permease [Bacteroidia bacterium]|jgi:ABC-2 type transport system permease protein
MLKHIFLVLSREYLTRVRKKSFLVMTLLAPLLIVAFYGLIIYLSLNQEKTDTEKQVFVYDETKMFKDKLQNSTTLQFHFGAEPDAGKQRALLSEEDYAAILMLTGDSGEITSRLIYTTQPGMFTVEKIQSQLSQILKDRSLALHGIDQQVLQEINRHKHTLQTVKLTDEGFETGSSGVSSAIGMISAIAIYTFIFIYGVQVMQGVIEEKTNRIVEILISSLRPFELMMGKIMGIALVGLTQFFIWGVAIVFLGSYVSGFVMRMFGGQVQSITAAAQGSGAGEMFASLSGVNFPLIGGMFLFYFLGGYLFYGALFAAIGSAVDNETDKQQFMMPVTLPLILAFALSQTIILSNPNSSTAIWLSIIPFTSPVAMMVRLPFDVPGWQLALSMVSMILGFISTAWIASRIYRIGILMYGKKPSWKELGKWLFYKG